MALKKKERPLSREELIEKLKRDAAPRWLHGEPEFAMIASPQGNQLLPLKDSFEKKITLLFLMDAGDYLTMRVFEALHIWKDRYKNLPWQSIVAFQQKYLFLKNPHFFESFKIIKSFAALPLYLDPFGELFEKYGSKSEPVVVAFNAGELVFSGPLLPDFPNKLLELEGKLQAQLRQKDQGLPLPLLYEYQITAPVDQKMILPKDTILEGKWGDAGDSWIAQDSNAVLTIPFEGKNLRWIVTLHPQAGDHCRVIVTLNGAPLNQNMSGQHIRYDEKGNSLIEIARNTGNYEVIDSPEPIRGILKIQMTNTNESPVIFYEARSA